MTIGDRIKEARTKSKLSQSKLAKMSGISQSAISAVELGSKSPTFDTLERIAKALGCAIKELADEDELSSFSTAPQSRIDDDLAEAASRLTQDEVKQVIAYIAGLTSARK